MLAIHSLGAPWLDKLMKAVTHAASGGAALITGVAAIWLWRHRRREETVALLICVAGAAAANAILKQVFARPRPLVFPPLTIELTYSFPSGHTITALALYGFLAILLWRAGHRVWALLAGATIPLIGFSRIYLGVHYPSDVLAATTLGILWLILIFTGLASYNRRHPSETTQD
ncbi:MAG: phosphatase PAP2 family protein [Caldilineales bacterium]